MSDVTRILSAVEEGDPHAADQLLPLVYEELRRLAARRLAHEKPGQTLQATALVHEAYLRLVTPPKSPPSQGGGQGGVQWNGRGHFFAAAAEAMRRILVEQARRRHAAKRGGNQEPEELNDSALAMPGDVEEILAVHDVLDHFATIDPTAANLVKLRFFAGMTMDEAADALGMSVRSAYEIWAYARSWLHQQIRTD